MGLVLIGRVVSAARGAADQQIVDLIRFGVHQHCAAMRAAIINSVGACCERRRCRYDCANARNSTNLRLILRRTGSGFSAIAPSRNQAGADDSLLPNSRQHYFGSNS
ncbi:MAG: hypothetical protein QOF09_4591 [Alphaproteobacteria bacterium]|nr:hypothetical protein [Alphaproteobacteria bacterium]